VGIVLWLVSAIIAFFLARMLPWLRPRRWIGEFLVTVVAALLLGVLATALDFGGWRELDWRAGLFAGLGTLAVLGAFRLTIRPS
jgi:fluoride ion exporter CrcB/FEX